MNRNRASVVTPVDKNHRQHCTDLLGADDVEWVLTGALEYSTRAERKRGLDLCASVVQFAQADQTMGVLPPAHRNLDSKLTAAHHAEHASC